LYLPHDFIELLEVRISEFNPSFFSLLDIFQFPAKPMELFPSQLNPTSESFIFALKVSKLDGDLLGDELAAKEEFD
jgi:hypothetical protein